MGFAKHVPLSDSSIRNSMASFLEANTPDWPPNYHFGYEFICLFQGKFWRWRVDPADQFESRPSDVGGNDLMLGVMAYVEGRNR